MTANTIDKPRQMPNKYLPLEQMDARDIILELYKMLSQEAERELSFLDFAEELSKLFGMDRTSKIYNLLVETWQAEGLRPADYEEIRILLFDRYKIFQAELDTPKEQVGESASISDASEEALEQEPAQEAPVKEDLSEQTNITPSEELAEPKPKIEIVSDEPTAKIEIVPNEPMVRIMEVAEQSSSIAPSAVSTPFTEPELPPLLPGKENKIVNWAYFGESKRTWQPYYEQLKSMSPKVNGQPSKRMQDVGTLRKYIANAFKLLQYNIDQQHLYIAIDTNEEYACFHTGLTDASDEAIYALFKRNTIIVSNPKQWIFQSFCTLSSPDGSIIKEHFEDHLPSLHPHFTEAKPEAFTPLGAVEDYVIQEEGMTKAIGLFPVDALIELRDVLSDFYIQDLEQLDEFRGFDGILEKDQVRKRLQITRDINHDPDIRSAVMEGYLFAAVEDSLSFVEDHPELALPYPSHFDRGNHQTYLIPLLSSEAFELSDEETIANLGNYIDMVILMRINDDGSRAVTYIDSIDNIYDLSHLREPNDFGWLTKTLAEQSERNRRSPRPKDF